MLKKKKIPMRMCVGCRQMIPKKELLRIVRTPEGEIIFDSTGKKNGRGAYICPDVKCLKIAIKQKQLQRALESNINNDFEQELEKAIERREFELERNKLL